MIGDYNENSKGMSDEFKLLIYVLNINDGNFMNNSKKEFYNDINWNKFITLAIHCNQRL